MTESATKTEVEGDSKSSSSSARTTQGRSRKQIFYSNVQFAALCYCMFVTGWNDGTAGPLIPKLREFYSVGFTVVSMLFVTSCAGFIFGALINVWLTDRLGFGKVLVLGAFLQIITYSVQAPAPPFAAFVVMNLINGCGLALQDAQANGFVGSLSHYQETKMGILHATYGLGAFAAPLVSTQFAQMRRWSFHYLISLGLAVLNTIIMTLVFRFRRMDPCLIEGGEDVHVSTKAQDKGKFGQIMKNKAVFLLSAFILIYVGVEVTIGGWIVTYIIEERNGGPSAGYVASGFFGGLTLGRVILLPVNKWVGEHRVLFIYAILSLGLEFVIWFVPSLIGNAVTVSIIGMLLGPMYPIAINQASRILPRWILTGAVGFIAGFGQAGSALIPFITGAIAERHGIKSLHPLLIAMMALMIALFWLTPNKPQIVTPPPELEVQEKEEVVDQKEKEPTPA